LGLLDFNLDGLNSDQGRMALGLLSAAGPSAVPQSFGQRINGAMAQFRQQKAEEDDRKMKQAQFALQQQLAQMGLQKGGLELQQMQGSITRQNNIRDELAAMDLAQRGGQQPASAGIPMPAAPDQAGGFSDGAYQPPQKNVGPTVGAAASMAVKPPTTGPNFTDQYTQRLIAKADVYQRNGEFDSADKLLSQAAKFMPEVKEMTTQVDRQSGQPVTVITYKDGRQQVSGFAPKPQVHYLDNGGSIQAINELDNSPIGAAVKKVVSPDTVYTGAITKRGQNMTDSRAAQTLKKDYIVAGMNPDGTPTGDVEGMAQMVAAGKVPPLSGFALANPRGQRIMARVAEINPTYDYTDVTAKNAAAKAFTTGQQGNALRSVATANDHLDQFGELVSALDNGNTQIVNKVSNWYKTQTGSPAPTNFDGIKNVIGQEVVKAIVAGGGGVGEREEAAKAFSSANSPAQLNGLIAHYKMVMGAQQKNLLEQRRAAGLSDSTLPSYIKGGVKLNPILDQADAILGGR